MNDMFYIFNDPFFPYFGNPNIKPETAWNYDIGIEKKGQKWHSKLTGYHSDVKNLIQTKPITYDTVVNIGKSYKNGAEVELGYSPFLSWRHSVSYSYLQSKGQPAGSSKYLTLAYMPRHTARYEMDWDIYRGLTLTNTVRFTDKRFSGNGDTGTKLTSYTLWDVKLSQKLLQAELYLRGENVLEHRYVERVGYPLPGRSVWGGVNIRFRN
jgi:outer membrane cobalamin receptor